LDGLSFPIPQCVTFGPRFAVRALFISDVLNVVAQGMAWEAINRALSISKEAIAEAVRVAREALINHVGELVVEPAR
jgi:hypothetical protein